MNTKNVPQVAERFLGAILPNGIKCVNFVKLVYHEAGLSSDFSLQPITPKLENIKHEQIGKLVFLMNKQRLSKLFNHIAIIYDENSVIHYSRHSSPDGIRRVQITSFTELLEVYNVVPNSYVSKPLV